MLHTFFSKQIGGEFYGHNAQNSDEHVEKQRRNSPDQPHEPLVNLLLALAHVSTASRSHAYLGAWCDRRSSSQHFFIPHASASYLTENRARKPRFIHAGDESLFLVGEAWMGGSCLCHSFLLLVIALRLTYRFFEGKYPRSIQRKISQPR